MTESIAEHVIDIYGSTKETPVTVEIELLYVSINELEKTIKNYIDDTIYIWESIIVPFMNSGDCLTLQKLNETQYSSFSDFMCSQKTYKFMMISYSRLTERLKYLIGS